MKVDEFLHTQLKSYFSQHLAPICDADPDVLGDFIIALLKREQSLDSTESDLMIELHEFLRNDARPFVKSLFAFIRQTTHTPITTLSPAAVEIKQQQDSDEEDEENDKYHSRRRHNSKGFSEYHHSSTSTLSSSSRRRRRSPAEFSRSRGSRNSSYHTKHQFSKIPSNKLCVDNIPAEKYYQEALIDFFGKFGTISTIDLLPDGKSATIEFASMAEAEAAYSCPDPIFGNRFVKTYFKQQHQHEKQAVRRPRVSYYSVPVARSFPVPPQLNNKYNSNSFNTKESDEGTRKKMEMMLEFQKKKEEFITKQIETQKSLMQRLESDALSEDEKVSLIQLLKNASENVEQLRKSPNPTSIISRIPTISSTSPPLSNRTFKLDNRSKTVTVTDFAGQDITQIQAELSSVGIIKNCVVSPDKNTITVEYATPSHALKAIESASKYGKAVLLKSNEPKGSENCEMDIENN